VAAACLAARHLSTTRSLILPDGILIDLTHQGDWPLTRQSKSMTREDKTPPRQRDFQLRSPLLEIARALRRNPLGQPEWIVKQAMVKKAPNPVDRHVGSRVRMRRMMLGMSQETLGDGLGLTFQQVQKYENGKNRIGASRLQQISHILQIPVPFFFEGAPHLPGQPEVIGAPPLPTYVSEFLATIDGLALTKAFMKLRSQACGDASSSLSKRSRATN